MISYRSPSCKKTFYLGRSVIISVGSDKPIGQVQNLLASHSYSGINELKIWNHLNFCKCLSEESSIHLVVHLTYLYCYTTFSSLK